MAVKDLLDPKALTEYLKPRLLDRTLVYADIRHKNLPAQLIIANKDFFLTLYVYNQILTEYTYTIDRTFYLILKIEILEQSRTNQNQKVKYTVQTELYDLSNPELLQIIVNRINELTQLGEYSCHHNYEETQVSSRLNHYRKLINKEHNAVRITPHPTTVYT